MNKPKTAPKLFFCVDWIAYTCFRSANMGWRNIAKRYPDERWVGCAAYNGYTQAAKNQAGCMIMANPARPDMGYRAVYSGRALNNYAAAEIEPNHIIQHHNLMGDRCGRIDLAVDVYDGGVRPRDYYNLLESGKAKTRCREWPLVQSPTGETLYIGSRTSEACMRIYDKALKSGIPGDWKRVEIEIKGKKAVAAARAIMGGTIQQQALYSRGLMLGHVDFKTAGWTQIVGDTPIKAARSKDDLPDTEKWLLGQVATAMARRIHETGNGGLMDEFIRRVNGELADLRDADASVSREESE